MSVTRAFPPRPQPSAPRPYTFPYFERRTLGNGMTLIVAPSHKLPVVSAIAVIEAGAVCDPVGREGLAALTAAMLPEGTASLDGEALALRFESLGASVTTGADWDVATAGLTVTRPHLESALALARLPSKSVSSLNQARKPASVVTALPTRASGQAISVLMSMVNMVVRPFTRSSNEPHRSVQRSVSD